MKEIWKDIEGYEGYYQVSSLGRVRSLDRVVNSSYNKKNRVKGKVLRPGRDKDGYHQVGLRMFGESKNKKPHRLVALAFIPNPENKRTVNHINGIKTDNRDVNLEWMTQKENADHSWETGLSTHKGENHFNSALNISEVKEIRWLKINTKMTQVKMAEKFNVSTATISRVVNFDLWKDI